MINQIIKTTVLMAILCSFINIHAQFISKKQEARISRELDRRKYDQQYPHEYEKLLEIHCQSHEDNPECDGVMTDLHNAIKMVNQQESKKQVIQLQDKPMITRVLEQWTLHNYYKNNVMKKHPSINYDVFPVDDKEDLRKN